MRRHALSLTAALAVSCASLRTTEQAPAIPPTSRAHASFEFVYLWGADPPHSIANFGYELVVGDDIDRDGVRDLIVGAPDGGFGAGHVFVLSGRSGLELRRLKCPTLPPHGLCGFGASLCALGDIDDDGVDDFAVGDPSVHPWDGGDRPPWGAWIVSGARCEVRHELLETKVRGYGSFLFSVGDIDRDGCGDLLVRSKWGWHGDVVDAISSRTGARLYRVPVSSERPDEWTGRLIVCDDLDSDGVREFVDVFGPLEQHESTLRVRSGANGQILGEYDARASALVQESDARDEFVGDLDGDADPELLCYSASSFVSGRSFAVVTGAGQRVLARADIGFGYVKCLGDLDGDGTSEFAGLHPDEAWPLELFTLRRVEKGR